MSTNENTEVTAELSWGERLDADGEPVALVGKCQVVIGGDRAMLGFDITGTPDTLDAQLDAALGATGWERLSGIESWPGQSEPWCRGRCKVRQTP